RPTARRPTSASPPRTSRSTAAWASPGSTRPISTSSARRRAISCSATRRTTASGWRIWSGSESTSQSPQGPWSAVRLASERQPSADGRLLDQLEAGAVGIAEEHRVQAVDRDLGPHVEPARSGVRYAEAVELRTARARVLDEIGEAEPAELVRGLGGPAPRRPPRPPRAHAGP